MEDNFSESSEQLDKFCQMSYADYLTNFQVCLLFSI